MLYFGLLNLQVVEGGHNVSHNRHDKKRDLENIFTREIKPVDDGVIPCDII